LSPIEQNQLADNVHEVLDRSMIAADFWERYITMHRLVKDDPELKMEAERIAEALGAFYQLAGQRMPEQS